MNQELVFFDIDGTLSVPRYNDNGRLVIGFSDEGWENFCNNAGEDGYRDCIVVKPVVRYAEKRKSEGALLYVLSTAHYENEVKSKHKFINETFPGLFEEVLTVPRDPDKLTVISGMAEERGLKLSECELVEDTYATILKANEIGIKATHISEIVCNL